MAEKNTADGNRAIKVHKSLSLVSLCFPDLTKVTHTNSHDGRAFSAKNMQMHFGRSKHDAIGGVGW